jgi:hypothetical protein
MADYLAGYGAGDEQRERKRRRIVLFTIVGVIVALSLYLFLRNFREERVASSYLQALRGHDYRSAYRMWGCTEQTPCRDYTYDRFMADWGPAGTYSDPSRVSYGDVDSCGGGVVFTIQYPGAEASGLYVDRSSKVISFAPWPRCPGRHWNFKAAWRSMFGSPEPPPPPQ